MLFFCEGKRDVFKKFGGNWMSSCQVRVNLSVDHWQERLVIVACYGENLSCVVVESLAKLLQSEIGILVYDFAALLNGFRVSSKVLR